MRSPRFFLPTLLLLLLLLTLCPGAVRADLIGYWDFSTSDSLGTDRSGHGNTLQASDVNNVFYESYGVNGGSLYLSGNNSYLKPVGSMNGLPSGNSAYTVAAWVYPFYMDRQGIVGWGLYGVAYRCNTLRFDPTSGYGLDHYWWNSDLLASQSQISAAAGGANLNSGWNHVVTRYDGATRAIYVNGKKVVSDVPGVNNALNANFAIGTTNNNQYFSGYIDDVAIWNTALPESQIAALAANTVTPANGPKIKSFYASNSTGAEGQTLPLSWNVDASLVTGTLAVTIVQGTTTIYSGSAANGSCNVTLPAVNGTARTLSYTLTAVDSASNASAAAQLSIRDIPDVPVTTPQSGLVVTTPNALPITLSATDAGNLPLTYAIVVPPAHGTISGGTGTARTYTPTSGYVGLDTFSFKANNGKYDSASALVSLSVIAGNAAPTAITLSNTQLAAALPSGSWVGDFSSIDPNQGVPHVYTLVSGTGGTDNAKFSISGHQLLASQTLGASGTAYGIRVRSTNSAGLFVEQAFTLTTAAPAAGKVVINEILYNGQSNTVPDDFVELYNNTGAAVDLSGWQLTNAITYTFPAGTTLPVKGYLVVAANPAAIKSIWGVTALGPYTGNLSSDGETLNLVNASGTKVCEVDYTPRFPYPCAANGEGTSMELINPNLDPSLGSSWRPSLNTLAAYYYYYQGYNDYATPGAANSQYASNASPAIRQVAATPAQPTANAPVTITAKVTDPDGVQSVQLLYQIVAPGNFLPATQPNPIYNHLIQGADYPLNSNSAFEDPVNWVTVPMNDDGVNGDVQGGDGVYTATLPGQVNRTLVRYRIVVTDNQGYSDRVPYQDDQSLNFAYFVYNGVPDYQGTPAATLTKLPVYHFLTRLQDYNQCVAYDSANQLTGNTSSWNYENWEAAIVYDGKVYDHVLYRLHGANGRYYYTGKRAWRWFFNKGYEFQARDNDGNLFPEPWRHLVTENLWENRGTLTYSLNEMINFYLFQTLGIPSPYAAMINFRLVDNAQEQVDAYHGDYWGLMMVHEDYEKNFLDSHNLAKGNLYKLTRDGVSGLSQQRYQALNAVSDGSDHDTIYNQLKGTSTPGFITSHVNMAEYDYYHALAEAIRHYDYWPSGDNNGAYYFDPASYSAANGYLGQLWILPSDTDATWGPTWNNGHDVVHNALFNDSADVGGDSFTNPTLWPGFFNAVREVRDLLWQPDQINPLIDQFGAIILPQQAADNARWKNAPADAGNYNGLGGAGITSIANLIQDMKNFAFVGGSWPGGSGGSGGAVGTVGAGGRGAYLDTLQLGVNNSEATLPGTPTITYVGAANYPLNNLSFATSAFAGQGSNTFAGMQWRIAEVTDTVAPAYVAGQKQLLEWNASYDSGLLPNFVGQYRFPAAAARAGHTYRARVRHLDSAGRWSHWSAPAQFTATAANISGYQNSLVVSEFMYYPATITAAETAAGYAQDDFQFLEVRNVGTAPVDLTDVSITKGVAFSFPSGTTLAAGASTVVVANSAAFATRYGTGRPVAGSWQSSGQSLAHKGEEITLSYGGTQSIVDFTYTNASPWPAVKSGSGYSCVLIAPNTLPDPTNPANWRASYAVGGNPGGNDTLTYAWWAAAYPGVAGNSNGCLSGNGISNLMEYALGGNPSTGSLTILPKQGIQALSVNGTTANYLTLAFRHQGDSQDLTYHVEFSTDLNTWSETGTLVSTVSNGDGTYTQTWRGATPLGAATKAQFVRLRVTTP